MYPGNLDILSLRALVAIVDGGSFAHAARVIGRTAPAVSLQIGRLEEQTGCRLFRKEGRRMVPTPEGERLVEAARAIVQANDRILDTLRDGALSGIVRIAAVQEFADSFLPEILASFNATHPEVRISARVGATAHLLEEIRRGALDLVIGLSDPEDGFGTVLATEPMIWLSRPGFAPERDAPVPLVVLDDPCRFRDAALARLERAGREWRIVFGSPSLSGVRAAVSAGLGIAPGTRLLTGKGIVPCRDQTLPPLPSIAFTLFEKPSLDRAAARLSEIIRNAVLTAA